MVPDFKELVVGHYNFINEDEHGKHVFQMLNQITSFRSFSTKQITLYNTLKRMDRNG